MKYEVHFRPAGGTWSPTNLGTFDTQAEAGEASKHWLTGYARVTRGVGVGVRVVPAGHAGREAEHAGELLEALKAVLVVTRGDPRLFEEFTLPDGRTILPGAFARRVIVESTGEEDPT